MNHLQLIPVRDFLVQMDAHLHGSVKRNLFPVHAYADVIQTGQNHVVRVQRRRSLLPVGFIRFAAGQNFFGSQLGVIRDMRLRSVFHLNDIGVAPGVQNPDPGCPDHTVNREAVR